jgi:hypothetical protein
MQHRGGDACKRCTVCHTSQSGYEGSNPPHPSTAYHNAPEFVHVCVESYVSVSVCVSVTACLCVCVCLC